MRSDTHESSSDVSSQKSVTDWLMHVISGKKPIELHIHNAAPEKGQPEPEAVAVEAKSTATAADSPSDSMVKQEAALTAESKDETTTHNHVFTAEDLCGAPLIPIVPVAKSALEDISAADLCWVPKGEDEKTHLNGPASVVPVEESVPTDIWRDPVPAMPEPDANAIREILHRLEADEHAVRPSDILREQAPHSEEQRASEASVEEIFLHPVTAESAIEEAVTASKHEASEAEAVAVTEAHADDAEAATASVEETHATDADADAIAPVVEEAATEAASPTPEAEPVAESSTEPAVEAETVPEATPQEAIAPEAAEATVDSAAEEKLQDEPPVGEVESGSIVDSPAEETEPAVAETRESVFAHEGIWSEQERAEAPGGRRHVIDEAGTVYAGDLPHPSPEELRALEKIKPEGWRSTWKTLMRLGSVLPWLSRALPMLETGFEGEQSTGLTQEVRHEVAGIRLVQYEIKTAVQDHSLQLKRMEEQLTRVRESLNSRENDELAESVKSTAKLVQIAGIGLGALLLALLIMVGVLLARVH